MPTLPRVRILLPPSEGKRVPADGPPADLNSLSFPQLNATRAEILAALIQLCRSDPESATTTLGLGPTQADAVARNANLADEPAAPAHAVYTGVLYEALTWDTLPPDAVARAYDTVVITSGLWGMLGPGDRIPAYRLSGGVNLPGIGSLASTWRPALRDAVSATFSEHLVVDMRSGTYEGFWRPDATTATHTVKVRVLHERDGVRTVVSHHNKATKGQLVRALLTNTYALAGFSHAPADLSHAKAPADPQAPAEPHTPSDSYTPAPTSTPANPHTPAELADLLLSLGWKAELTTPERSGRPWTLNVVMTELP